MNGMYADMGTPKGEATCVSKYLLFRCLERAVPVHIERLFELYTLDYVKRFVSDDDVAMERKEEIDDYLEDVQYRVIDRLDQVHEVKKLQAYFKMDIGKLVDKMNSLAVSEKVKIILSK